MPIPDTQQAGKLPRRAILKGSVAGTLLGALAGEAAGRNPSTNADVPLDADDIRAIASGLFGLSLPSDHADRIAQTSATLLPGLQYLTLLKTEAVSVPLDYEALVRAAARRF